MILAHLADLHLGYRAYHRVAPGGMNMREHDVARAFGLAVDRLIELQPALVLVAGDVFHSVRPPNAAIAGAFRQFARLRRALPHAPVVVISGNHDSPRSVESGSILRLLAEIPGITLVEGEAGTVRLEDPDVSVLCVPHAAASSGGMPPWEPDPEAAVNVLMLHGTVTGGAADGKLRRLVEYGGADVSVEAIRPELWDYVALGHYHMLTDLAPNMWYAGALERTSSNIWEEVGEKGFLTFDTDTHRTSFHPVPTRDVIDLPRVCARVRGSVGGSRDPGAREGGRRLMEPTELDVAIRDAVERVPGGLEGKVVRLVCTDVPRELFRALDHARIREYKARALHFQLDVRRPRTAHVDVDAPERRRTLEEELDAFLRERYEPGSGGIERDRLVRLAVGYLREVGDASPGEGWGPDDVGLANEGGQGGDA